jgi:hypothetical protein
MTVEELIEKLKLFNGNAEVRCIGFGNDADYKIVDCEAEFSDYVTLGLEKDYEDESGRID